jgi:hypothetical protein
MKHSLCNIIAVAAMVLAGCESHVNKSVKETPLPTQQPEKKQLSAPVPQAAVPPAVPKLIKWRWDLAWPDTNGGIICCTIFSATNLLLKFPQEWSILMCITNHEFVVTNNKPMEFFTAVADHTDVWP